MNERMRKSSQFEASIRGFGRLTKLRVECQTTPIEARVWHNICLARRPIDSSSDSTAFITFDWPFSTEILVFEY